MASSSMDDDGFRVRVEKIFGSLASSNSSSPWSLTDDEVERREWRRDKDLSARDETPCSSSFDEFWRKDRLRQRNFPGNGEGDEDRDSIRDEWEIRSSIGLDNTLDNEEEEDEFDKVASGRENAGERLYMNDVNDGGSYLNMHNVVLNSLNGGTKDPRANHHAARIRLEQDEDEAQKSNFPCSESHAEVNESHAKVPDNSCQPRSILKRKDNRADSKPQKRVRFDPGCKIDTDEASEKIQCSSVGTSSVGATVLDDKSLLARNYEIPDYILNPSKYTRYSFDSSDEFNDDSSTKACMDVLRLVKNSKAKEVGPDVENASSDLPKSVTFIPKKKAGDIKAENMSSEIKGSKEDDVKQLLPRTGFLLGIAAAESQYFKVNGEEEIEVIADQEIEPKTNAIDDIARYHKPGRKYRSRSRSEDFDS